MSWFRKYWWLIILAIVTIIVTYSAIWVEANRSQEGLFAWRAFNFLTSWSSVLVAAATVTLAFATFLLIWQTGLMYNYVITNKYGAVELYIDNVKEDTNKSIFDILKAKKNEIESTFGGNLIWDYREGRRAQIISWAIEGIGLKTEDKWESLQDKMIDSMIRLERALREHIKALPI